MSAKRSEILWQALAVVAVSCLVVMTGILVRREFADSPVVAIAPQPRAAVSEAPTPVPDWQRVVGAGKTIGPADAPVTIVVFSDFQCPYCARFATETWPALQKRYPGKVALLFRHWPLRNHEHALPAARAAECAALQGQFEEFHNSLFTQPDSLGVKTFTAFAAESGVRDLKAFDACVKTTTRNSAIDNDIAEVKRIGGRGTPTLVINGLLLRPPYSAAAIADHVEAALSRAPLRKASR